MMMSSSNPVPVFLTLVPLTAFCGTGAPSKEKVVRDRARVRDKEEERVRESPEGHATGKTTRIAGNYVTKRVHLPQ